MKISDFIDKFTQDNGRAPRIGFVGVGRSNIALMAECGAMQVSVRSDAPIRTALPENIKGCDVRYGEGCLGGIYEDILFLSPSVRRDRSELVDAASRGVRLSSDAELFFENNNADIYAVTGSDGKSTTTALAAALLSEKHPGVSAIGNIGVPFCAAVGSCLVAELSSFQLTSIAPRVKAALITGITPNHLNWHKSMDEYVRSKMNVFVNAERTVISPDTNCTAQIAESNKHSAVYSVKYSYGTLAARFPADEHYSIENGCIARNGVSILPVSALKKREMHNVHNLMGAVALTRGEYSRKALLDVASGFSGLSHRCELFLSVSGVDFIDSSIDTSPARTAVTLRSLGKPVRIILGGRSKGIPLGECIEELRKYATRISLYGECAEEYFDTLERYGITKVCKCVVFEGFDEAVDYLLDGIASGETLLLSPAATGYGEFESFAERGDHFKDYIQKKYLRS